MNERLTEEKSLTRITKTSEKFTTIDGIRKTVNIKTNSKKCHEHSMRYKI